MGKKTYQIQEIGEVVGGGTPSTKIAAYWDGDIAWISPADLSHYNNVYIEKGKNNITQLGLKKSSTVLLPPNTVLLTSRAPIGYIALAKNSICTNQGFKSIICNPKFVNYRYLYYYLRQSMDYIKLFASGSTFPELSGTRLKRIKITIEQDVTVQKKIASILSAYDDLIENNNKRIKILEQMAENLYKEWFVRFRFPGYETAEFENGIPKGWEILRMKNFCYVTDGTHDTPKETNLGVPLVTGRCIRNGFVDYDEAYLISEDDHNKIKKRSGLKSGDILFSNIGTVGNTCLVDYEREFSVKNVIIFKPPIRAISAYLYYWLISPSMQAIFSTQTNGASQQFVGLTFMRRIKILVPNKYIMTSFEKNVAPIIDAMMMLHKENQNLIKQRDLLLPRLMSGKLEVEM